MAIELDWSDWKLGFAAGLGAKPWRRTIAARDLSALWDMIAKTRQRFALPDDAAVSRCYEAGRDGFWLHRFLSEAGVDNCVVDSASTEVNEASGRAAARMFSLIGSAQRHSLEPCPTCTTCSDTCPPRPSVNSTHSCPTAGPPKTLMPHPFVERLRRSARCFD